MNAKRLPDRADFALRPHEVIEFDHLRPGAGFECRQGILWLTCDGDLHDHVLEPGQRFIPSRRGRIVIEAMRESLFTMSNN